MRRAIVGRSGICRSGRRLRIRPADVTHFQCRVGDTWRWQSRRKSSRAEAARAKCAPDSAAAAATASVATVAVAFGTELAAAAGHHAGHHAGGSTGLHAATVSRCRSAAAAHVSAMRHVARAARAGAKRSVIANAGHGAATSAWDAGAGDATGSAADAWSWPPRPRQETPLMAYVRTCRIARVDCPPRPRRHMGLRSIGRLRALIYVNDRGDRRRPRTFIHFMRRWPRLSCDRSGRQLFIVGGNYRVTPRGIEG